MALERTSDEMLLLVKTFEEFEVRYLIVGGFAVNRHGYKRATGDIDFYLKDTPQNRLNLINALDKMGYGRFEPLLTAPILAGYCEIMLDSGIYADLMTDIPGLEQQKFDEYYSMALSDKMEGFEIRFINYQHLIQNKIATGRNKDLLDVEELKKINSQH
jgi:hypothetical protein